MIIFSGVVSDEIQSKTFKKRQQHVFRVCAINFIAIIIVGGVLWFLLNGELKRWLLASGVLIVVLLFTLWNPRKKLPFRWEYSIENLNGEIEIIQDRIIVFFDSYQIDISKFDFYKIIDNNGQIRYFQADTDTKDILDNPFGLIIIYLPSADYRHKDYTMEILYGNAVEKEVYNVTVILEDNEIGYFESISENKQLNNDELSLRLINAI